MSLIEHDALNQAAIDRLIARCGSAGCTPFVGAGLSMPWDFPSWWTFLIKAAQSCGVDAHIETVLKGDRYDRYEFAAEIVDETLIDRGQRHGIAQSVRKTFGRRVLASAKPQEAVHSLPAIARGAVITTNFDRVIEEVFSAQGRPLFPVWGARMRVVQDSLSADAPVLVKVHGDALHAHDRILTRAEYDRHYGASVRERFSPEKPVPQLLRAIFATKPVLFLGCSLADDRTMDVLSSIATEARTQCFAVLAREACRADQREKEARMARFGIVPIWYPAGEHDAIRPFLEHLAGRLPGASMSSVALGRTTKANADLAEERRAAWASLSEVEAKATTLARMRNHDRQWDRYFQQRESLDLASSQVRLRLYVVIEKRALPQNPDRALSVQIAAYFVLRGLGEDRAALKVLDRARQTAQDMLPSGMTVDLHYTLASHYSHIHDWARASLHSRLGLRQARAIRFEHTYAYRRMWYRRGRILLELGKRRGARRYLRAALCDARRAGDANDIAHFIGGLAGRYFDYDQPRWAARLARIGIRYAPLTAYADRATLFGNLGSALRSLGELEEGTDAHRQAWWYQLQGTRDGVGVLIHVANVAWFEYRIFDHSGAPALVDGLANTHLEWSLDLFDQAIHVAEAEGLSRSKAHLLVQRALPLARVGHFDEALADIRRAMHYLRRVNSDFAATAYNNWAVIWQWKGRRSLARYWYEQALSAAKDEGASGLHNTIAENLKRL
jgi:tetratricopeptide (TPR) repeat protein